MNRLAKWLLYSVGGIALLLVLAAGGVFFLSQRALADVGDPLSLDRRAPTPAQLADAPRQLKVMGCVSCHGEGMAGKLFLDEAGVATLHAPNISRLARSMDDAALDRAIRGGIGHDGRALLIMPSENYQFLDDGEVAALIAAIRALPPTGEESPARAIGPLARLGLASGEFKTAPAARAHHAANPLPRLGDTAAGRHLVELNCSGCHGADLAGKEIDPEVTSTSLDAVAGYDAAQFRDLLRRGVAPSGKDLGLMAEVAKSDFMHLTDAEIEAIRTYLDAHARR